jgi:L-iditol 2-dehydrogenase
MRAVFLPGGRAAVVREVDIPRPGAGEVLIAMRAAGLCGSDLHMHYRPSPEQRRGSIFGMVTNPDIVPGHEPAGLVADVGEDIHYLTVGQRVAVHHMSGCGHCMQCRRGWDINCQQKNGIYGLDRPGAMQDFMVARERDCVIIPDRVTFAEAAYFTCGAGTGYLALKRAGLALGDSVAVVGLGPVGIAAAFFAKSAGARVVGIDPMLIRREFAQGIGITAVDASEETTLERARSALADSGANVVIESSGSSRGRALALDLAALNGRVVCVGFGDAENIIDVQAQIIQKQLDVRGAWMFPLPDLQDMLDDVSHSRVSIEPLIGQSYSISDAQAAWKSFDDGAAGKIVIEWRDEQRG